MSLETQLIALAQAIGTDIKDLRGKQGDLTALTTTAKTSIVAAINEIKLALSGAGVTINDLAGNGDTGVTWSADKVYDTIEAAKIALRSELTNGASAALDTFKELQDAIGSDPTFAATMATSLSNRVRFDADQTLTTPQKLQACTNLGIGDPEANFAAAYATAKV